MKIAVINQVLGSCDVFNSKADVARHVSVHVNTVSNWQMSEGIKSHKDYLICFDTTIHKSTGKIRSTGFR